LTGNFDIVELSVLELRQVVAQVVQKLDSRAGIQIFFISIPPLLQPLNILVMGLFDPQEVVLVVFLKRGADGKKFFSDTKYLYIREMNRRDLEPFG
jgi:hypothetical protein